MKRLGVVAAVLAGLYLAYALAYPTYSYRFRLAVEVEKDGQIKSASSVIEVKSTQFPRWMTLGHTTSSTSVRGEAVFLDLGAGQHLVAVFWFGPDGQRNVEQIPPKALLSDTDYARGSEGHGPHWTRRLAATSGRRDVSGTLLPLLVRFRDINDPRTVERVDPSDLASTFGPGVRLRRVSIELTRDAVTRGIEFKLPWITGFKGVTGGQLHPDWSRPERNLAAGRFIKRGL